MSSTHKNAFLRSLPPETLAGLTEHLKLVDLTLGQRLQEQGLRCEWIHFSCTALLSLISINGGGQSVETSMAGSEGAAGVLEALGSGQSSVECVVQVDGQAWRMPAGAFRKAVAADPQLNAAAWRLVELQMIESRQSGLCQAMHTVQARFSRWLLESLERSDNRNPLPMTQEFLAAMLGVQRTTVSAFASQLQRDGDITYSRGRLRIEDLGSLQARACDCVAAMREQRNRLGLTP